MFTTINRIFNFFVNELLYNGYLQSLGAAGIVYIASTMVLDQDPALGLLLATFLIFHFIFLHDRYIDLKKDKSTNPARTKHLKKYSKNIPYILTLIFLAVIFGILFFSNLSSLLFVLIILFFGFLYPIYFKSLTRSIYLFKNLYVSAVYAALVFFPILYYSIQQVNIRILLIIFTFIFLESIINQVALDTKDIKTDKIRGLLTLPVAIGKEKSLKSLKYFSIISGLIFTLTSFYYDAGQTFVLLILVSLLINLFFIDMIYKGKGTGYALSAGKFLVWFLTALAYRLIL